MQFPRQCPGGSTRVACVMEIHPFRPFVTGQSDVRCVDDNDMVTTIVCKEIGELFIGSYAANQWVLLIVWIQEI